jgi:hypothetical protein
MTEPLRFQARAKESGTEAMGHIRSDADALKRLEDTALLLYAVRQAALLFWSIVCKRWPELKQR